MSRAFQAPRGTFDVLPDQEEARFAVERAARSILGRAGYRRIETPAFEDTELFARSVGEATDIVRKEMFTFTDAGDRSLTLRPEGTAPICRAYVEHGMHRLAQPVKLWYAGPYFRQERPQAGRFRQFQQLGAEAIGSDSPLVDAEMILQLGEILSELAVPSLRLRLSSLGSPATRASYRDELRDYLRGHEADLAPEVRERIDLNPLRAFDSDHEPTRAVMAEAPTLLERLDDADAEHFTEVRRLLDSEGLAYEVDRVLVRGLDYYTRTVFEFTCDELGAQSGVAGGGRYDGLVEELGGPATPGIGWAAGVERILLATGAEPSQPPHDVFVAVVSEEDRSRAFTLAAQLRREGLRAECDLAGRSLKGQLKHADRLGARRTVIIEEGGRVQLKDMGTGEQREVELGQVIQELSV